MTKVSLGELYHQLCNAIQNANQNNKDVFKVPVFIRTENHSNSRYCIEGISEEFGRLGMSCEIITETNGKYSQRLYYVAPDERPNEGEYCTSRGVGYDLSCFVKSKLAGERILRMIKYILETDNPKSFLDYREYEPNWIQFKFKKEEFDLTLLDKLIKQNNNVITLEILKQCKTSEIKSVELMNE